MTTGTHRSFATALETLTAHHQQVLILHDIERMRSEDIGHHLGISAAQARIALRHGRLAVRQRLSDRLRAAA